MTISQSGSRSISICCIFLVFSIPYSVLFVFFYLLAAIECMLFTLLHPRTGCGQGRSRQLAFLKYELQCREYIWDAAQSVAEMADNLHGCLRRVLLPSLRIRDSEQHKEYMSQHAKLSQEIRTEIEHSRRVVEIMREQRRTRMKNLADIGEYDPNEAQLLTVVINETHQLKNHIETLEKDLRTIDHIAKTQASADYTGYHGLAEWADKMLENHKDPLEALCQVSFIGAGLTYSSIFSATRGSIGLMCWAFALFNFGFIIPLVALGLLKWTSSRPRDMMFATPHMWSVFLNLFVYVSVVAVVAAICLLSVTILLLHFPKDDTHSFADSPPQFNVDPRPAGASVMICAFVTVVMTLCAAVLHYMANGWSTLLRDLAGRRRENPGHRLKEYIVQ